MKRKDFLKKSGIAAASLAILPASGLFANPTDKLVRLVLIGVGFRGRIIWNYY